MADEILNGLKGIKQELKAVQDQMAGLDAGSQEFVKLSQKAGELRDRMKDVKEAVNANAGPAITSFGNNLSIARGQLMELDLQGFGESLKRVGENIKGVDIKSFKDGLKSMAEGFVNVGKALLSNPLFLVAATIAAAAVALNAYMQSQKEKMEKFVASIDKAIEDRQRKEQLYQAQNDLTTRREFERNQKLREKELKDIELQMYLIGQMKMNAQLTEEEYSKRHEELYKRKNQVEIEYATDAKKITEQTVKFKEKLDNEYELSRLNERDRFRKLNKDAEEQAIKEAFDLGINDLNRQSQIKLTYRQKLKDQEAKWAEEDAEKAKAAAEKKKQEEEKRKKETIDRRKALSDFNAEQDAEDYQMALAQTEQMGKLGQDLTDKERERAIEKTEIAKTAYEELDGYDKVYVSQLLERSDEATQHQIDNAKKLRDAEFDKRDKLLKLAKEGEQAISDVGAAYFATKMSRIDKETVAGAAAYEALARKQFEFNKKMQLAGAVIDLAKSINASLASSPVAIGAVPNPAGIASLVFASATGLANIAKIAATQYESPNAQSSTSPSPSSGGGAMSAPSAQSPSALNLSFLEGNVNTAPLQTYVLAGQVSNAQQAEFKIKNTASILGGG